MSARPFQALASAETDPLLRACYEIADLWAQYRYSDAPLGSAALTRFLDLVRAAENRGRDAAEALTPGALNPLRPTIREYDLARNGQPEAMHAAVLRRLARRRGPMGVPTRPAGRDGVPPMAGQIALEQPAQVTHA